MRSRCETRPIIILGVDRSGTSLVAKLVRDWGAFGGEDAQLVRRDPFNPTGYWEYRPMVLFMRDVFQAVGPDFWRADYEQALRAKGGDLELRKPAQALIAKMGAEARPAWFWKEPLLSVQLPFWQQIWGDATYIVTVRNPYDSAVSWEKMIRPRELEGQISLLSLNLLRWHHFMLSILTHIDSSPRKIFVSYEDLIRDPATQCDRLCRFLDLETGLDRRGEGRAEAMSRSVNPDLWRNNSRTDFDEIALASREQRELFKLMRRKVANPAEPFDPTAYPIYPGWREYFGNFAAFQGFHQNVTEMLRSRPVRTALAVQQLLSKVRRKAVGDFERGRRVSAHAL